jgi:hypothetical protein
MRDRPARSCETSVLVSPPPRGCAYQRDPGSEEESGAGLGDRGGRHLKVVEAKAVPRNECQSKRVARCQEHIS